MTSKAEKLLARMRRSRRSWKRRDIETLYLGFGFEIRSGSNHDIVSHPNYPQLRDVLPRHRQLAKGYVEDAVKLVERLLQLQEESELNRETDEETQEDE